MAITINDQPYTWTPRGQKLIYDLTSTNSANTGFKFGIEVVDIAIGKTYNFFFDPSPDGHAYFDLNPLVSLLNKESTAIHGTTTTVHTELNGNSWKSYSLTFTEWWVVGGVLTQNDGASADATTAVYNGYLQPIEGYRPNVFASSNKEVKIANNANSDYMQSDRRFDTFTFALAESLGITPGSNTVFIPAHESDWGLLFVTGSDEFCSPTTIDTYRVEIFGTSPASAFIPFTASPQIGIPCYPQNLKNSVDPLVPDPISSGWEYYIISAYNGGSRVSKQYIFFDTEKFGQYDCRYEYKRLAWTNSRGGWDYFNFIKKNEVTNNIERKQYKRVLFNGTSTIFSRYDRQQYDRQNIVTQTLSLASDWVQENEFEFLRSLMVSNQVHLVESNGTHIPVSVEESTFLERKERNGKLYNVTLKVGYSQDYSS
jgi:hypothetical protein